MIFHANSNQEYKVIILILGKIQLKSKKVIRNRRINKRSTKQEIIIFIIIHLRICHQNREAKTDSTEGRKFYNNSWEASIFHYRGFEQHNKSTKYKRNIQNTLRWDLPKIDYMLGHKLNFNKLKKRCHKVPFLTTKDEARLVAERKLKNPQVCGNWTTCVIPTTNGLKDKSQRKLENILRQMKRKTQKGWKHKHMGCSKSSAARETHSMWAAWLTFKKEESYASTT